MAGILDFLGGQMPQQYGGVAIDDASREEFARQALMQIGQSMLMPMTQIGPNQQMDYLAPLRALGGVSGAGQEFAKGKAQESLAAEDIAYKRKKRGREDEEWDIKKKNQEITDILNQQRVAAGKDAATKRGREETQYQEGEQWEAGFKPPAGMPEELAQYMATQMSVGDREGALSTYGGWVNMRLEEARENTDMAERAAMMREVLPEKMKPYAEIIAESDTAFNAITKELSGVSGGQTPVMSQGEKDNRKIIDKRVADMKQSGKVQTGTRKVFGSQKPEPVYGDAKETFYVHPDTGEKTKDYAQAVQWATQMGQPGAPAGGAGNEQEMISAVTAKYSDAEMKQIYDSAAFAQYPEGAERKRAVLNHLYQKMQG